MSFHRTDRRTAQGLHVLGACDLIVTGGANLGDPAGTIADMILGDVYTLSPLAARRRMLLAPVDGQPHMAVAKGSAAGQTGADVHFDCCATFMAPDGRTVETLVLAELEPGTGCLAQVHLLPLAEFQPKTDYALVDVSADNLRARFAALMCVSFVRGTRITLATGEMRPVEDIGVGDRVLTRDGGVQPVRWIGHQTMRAAGSFAPVVIRKGAMKNDRDLHLSPNQRLFVYQRQDLLQAGRAEVVVRAELLVDGRNVVRADGGFVEYFQILFDNHEFIFAEGIATESLTMNRATSPALPADVQARLGLPRGSHDAPMPVELAETMPDAEFAAEILRKAALL